MLQVLAGGLKTIDLNGDSATKVFSEVELMRSLNQHPHIVRFLGAQRDGTVLHIFQEWVPGCNIEELLKTMGPLTLQTIQRYLRQTLSRLVHLHESGIMHRDIKGSNILLDASVGIVKLADFGESKKLTNLKEHLMMKQTIVGTPPFS